MKRNTRYKKSDIDKMAATCSTPSVDKKGMYLKCTNMYIEISEYKEAMHYAQQYVKTAPKDYKGYKLLGFLHEKLGSVKEALKAYRRCTELNQTDTEAKENVSLLYCRSNEQLFRKKAWLDKMEKDMPQFNCTRKLRCHILQASGKTEELEQYLVKQLRQNAQDVDTHIELIQLLATRATDDALYFCCKLSPHFYRELALLQLSFSVVSKYLSNNKMEYYMAETILKTCNWTMSAVVREKRSDNERITSWVNFDSALYQLSQNLNVNEAPRWAALARECLSCLWMWIPCVVPELEDDALIGCAILALSAPLLGAATSVAEMSFYRSITSGVVFQRAKQEHPPLHISSIISRHCSSQAQLKLLQNITTKANSYCCDNIIRNVTVPTVPDLSGALMKYAQMRPRDLNLFVNVLVCMFDAGEAVPVENLVGSLLPKMKLHAQSLELVHTLDLCQDDLAALLHLLMKFPDMCTPTVCELWDEVCYITKIVPSGKTSNSALVKKGMWSIRAVSSHGLGPRECIVLAKYFSHRAALLFDGGGSDYEKYQQRSSHYWKVAYNIVTALQSYSFKRHNNALFTFAPLEEVELKELAQESGLAHAGALVNEGKFANALGAYSTIETPQAAFNAAQVYMHLADCTNTPKSKAKHHENAELELQKCKERALAFGDQEILKMIGLVEDSLPGRMKFVTKRGSFETPSHSTRYEMCHDTPFLDIDSKAKDQDTRSSVIKQLDFSPSKDSEAPCPEREDLTEQLHNLSINLQKQLERKDDEVSTLRNELLKLREELTQVRSDVSQMNSPAQGVAGLQGLNRATTPLWMRSDLPAQPSPGSPLVMHHPSLYHSPISGYPPASFPPAVTGFTASGVPASYPAAGGAGFHLPSYPGYPPLEQPPHHHPPPHHHLQQTLPPQHVFSPAHLQYPNISNSQEVPVPEAFQNVALSETLEPSSLSDSLKSDPVLKLKPQPAEVLASTPIVDRLGKVGGGTVFDSSAIKLPDLGGVMTSLPGKFTSNTAPRDVSPAVTASKPIEPGYFSCLLDKTQEEQQKEEAEVDYQGEESEGEEEEPSMLSKSQHFKAGSLAAPQDNQLQKSVNSSAGELETSTFTPQVALTEVTDFTTGEEDEVSVFDCRAKLFRFCQTEWKERGIGELKILHNPSTLTHRVVMRRDFILNICANHTITHDMNLTPAFGSEKAWVWFTLADMANEEPEPQQLAARFKTKEIAMEFKAAFDKAKAAAPAISSLTPATTTTSTSDGEDDEIKVIFEALPSEEDKARARQFLLPDTFYLPPRSACPGCNGCDVTTPDDDVTASDDDVVFVKEVLPPTPLKNLAAQYQLPPSFYNKRNANCKGCIGCLTDEDYHGTTADDVTRPGDVTPGSPEVQFIREVLPETPLKERAEQFMLPPSFYNVRYGKCEGCPGCADDADFHDLETEADGEEEVTVVKEVLPPTPLKNLAAQYKLPPSFYNNTTPCPGCAGCDQHEDTEADKSITITYEKPARDKVKAALFKLPPNFYDSPEKPCSGCLGCPDLDDVQEIYYQEEDEEEENLFGCARSDPNEPVSEKPLYDYLWPKEIAEEEDKGQFFSPVKKPCGDGGEEEEKRIYGGYATLFLFDTRRRDYVEQGKGSLSVLSSLSRTQYRVLYHDSASQTLRASHAIEGGMYVELVPSSTKLCWFVPIDYTDPETPLPRRFMVEFMSDSERENFRDVFMSCSKEMQGHVVNHKLVSLLAAGSPRKETPKSTKSVSFQQSPEIFQIEESSPEPYPEETPTKTQNEARPHNICANLKQEFEGFSQRILDYEQKETTPTNPQDTSVEIIKEVLPSADKQAKESEYSLPKGFYNYEEKEGCSGCVGCDEEGVEEVRESSNVPDKELTVVVEKTPSPPALYQVIPALDPAAQASPFGLNQPTNSSTFVSPDPGLFGISPSASPFTNSSSNSNIFLQNQPASNNNIFLQNQPASNNIFLQNNQNTDNIFLKSTTTENIFLKSSNATPSTPQQAMKPREPTFNPFASPPLPSLSPGNNQEDTEERYYDEEDYYDDEDYDDEEYGDYGYEDIQEEG
ncbi:hypothetical protein ACHWQZ_G002792 [Mnemiopsis leidyi]